MTRRSILKRLLAAPFVAPAIALCSSTFKKLKPKSANPEVHLELLDFESEGAMALLDIPGVSRVLERRDNRLMLLEFTVWGGDSEAIARTIMEHKTLGILTVGNTTVPVFAEGLDFTFEIRFNRPTETYGR